MVEVWDRLVSGHLIKTPVRSFEEGWELLETAGQYSRMEGSAIFSEGQMLAFWERGKNVVDLRKDAA